MKRIFFLAAGVLSITLLAFVEPPQSVKNTKSNKPSNNVVRTGEHEFSVGPGAVFKPEELLVFDRQDKDVYHIGNVKLSCGSSIQFDHTSELGIWVAFKEVKDENKRRRIWIGGSEDAIRNHPVLQEVEKILAGYAD
jgi:hypothetical protein